MLSSFSSKIKKTSKLLPPLLVRDIKERYAGSAIGVFWTFMQPLLFILLYWLVFSQIIKMRIHTDSGEIPFLPFLLSGLLPWFALNEGILRGASSIVEKGYIIKKVFYPSELFPISAALSSFIHHGIGFLIFLLVFFISRGGIALFQIPALGFLLLLQIMLTIGVSLLLSALAVYLRDILQILGIVFQALFYMTTILYPITSVPKSLKMYIDLNPFTSLIESYHNVILYGKYPEIGNILYISATTVIAMLSGVFIFRKLKKGFADVL